MRDPSSGNSPGSVSMACLAVVFWGLLLWNCAAATKTANPEGGAAANPGSRSENALETGDLARIWYALSLEDGSLVATNRPEALDRPRSDFFQPVEPMVAEDVVVGAEDALPPGVHRHLVGLAPGERRKAALEPESAYGAYDPSKRQAVLGLQRIPKTMTVPSDFYARRFGKAPESGDEVRLVPEVPFFPYRVTEAAEGQVRMEAMATDGEVYETDFGLLRVSVREGDILLDLEPRIGAPIQVEGRRGRIVGSEGRSFIVDFNHPLAGKTLQLDIEVVDRVPAAELPKNAIAWMEDPDLCQESAFLGERPQVVVLHRDGCSWCDKLFSETLDDPRVEVLADRFVWCRVDTGEDPDLRSRFRQDGTPNVIVLDPKGEVVDRRDGFVDASTMNRLLRSALERLKGQTPRP